jgi:AcrR family transcriptional regulator
MAATTRDRLLLAAAQLLDETGGRGASTRAICELAGVTAPTLYHHFGSKQGLVDEVLNHGFTRYVIAGQSGGDLDPVDAVRSGWDAHVRFGLAQPTFYVLLYGRIKPGIPCGITGPALSTLTGLLRSAAAAGRLRVPPADAAAQILAANVGATLSLIAEPPATRDLALSEHLREAVLTAVIVPAEPGAGLTRADAAGTLRSATEPAELRAGLTRAEAASTLRSALAADPSGLTAGEAALLGELLDRLAARS